MSSKPGHDLLSGPSKTSSFVSVSSSSCLSPTSSRVRRSSSNQSVLQSVFDANLLRITVIVCTTTVLLTVGSVVLYIGAVQRQLSQLREELVQMEKCVRRFAHSTGENGVFGPNDGERSSSDDLVLVSWYEEVETSVIHVPGSDLGVGADEEANEVVQMPGRRSKRQTPNGESGNTDARRERKSDGSRKEVPKKSNKKERTDKKRESTSRTQAVHFQPKNSSARTVTTKPNSPVLDFWQPVGWSNLVSNSFYHLRDGAVTIKEEGLYYIYAQIVFHDLSGRWSFSININDRQELKCINSEHISSASSLHPTNHGVYQHCFSSSLFYIRHLEQVTIRSLYEQRNILLSPEFTFWGLIKMS